MGMGKLKETWGRVFGGKDGENEREHIARAQSNVFFPLEFY